MHQGWGWWWFSYPRGTSFPRRWGKGEGPPRGCLRGSARALCPLLPHPIHLCARQRIKPTAEDDRERQESGPCLWHIRPAGRWPGRSRGIGGKAFFPSANRGKGLNR